MTAAARTRVGVWGVFGRGNFGNEATLTAFLGRLDGDVYSPILFCEDPAAASALHDDVPAERLGAPVVAPPRSRVLRIVKVATNRLGVVTRSIRAAGSVDTVVIAGTGGLERYGSGAFGTPFEIWALGVGCRLRRRPFVLLDVGVETLPRPMARFFVRGAARAAQYRSYRDEASRQSMLANGARAHNDAVVTDLAFSLSPARSPERGPRTVVVGVMDYWGRDDDHDATALHLDYAARLTALVRGLGASGWRVRLVGGDDGDLPLAHRIAADAAAFAVAVDASTPEALVAEMSAASVVVASRYHTLIMALLAGTPAISIGYSTKHAEILKQLDLPNTHRDIEQFDPDELLSLIETASDEAEQRGQRIDAAVHAARDRLDDQWDTVDRTMRSRTKRVSQ
jgi:polysaccharide pyruvyl transferase WcaK-like protein